MRRLLPLFLLLALLHMVPASTQTDDYIRADRLGIAHISTSTEITSAERYRRALLLGAGWNRWPIYWDRIETEPGQWTWDDYDRQVRADLFYGLQVNAILIGRPSFYVDEARITGISEPIFADGSDRPGEGKTLNPDNPWVNYVAQTVERYRPGGTLAQAGDLPNDTGIRVWEVWNEPDFSTFWQGSFNDYARLLKTSYIVVKWIDPEAQVMFGGLLYPTPENWLAQVLAILINDPLREENNWYFDIVGVHNYGDPWRSGWLTLYVRQTLIAYGLDKPIWLNETGLPVWDDYPGPVWDAASPSRGTLDQQAWFLIQSAVFAWEEGAEKVFYHQLYDDCGDQPAGTNFSPHNGELCRDGVLCAGDAFGMYRNVTGAVCFSQHPQPDTPRPVTRAFRLLAEVFGTVEFTNGERVFEDRRFVTLTFDRPTTNERITVMWNGTTEAAALAWSAVGLDGRLLSLDNTAVITPDENGAYMIDLPPALDDVDMSNSPQAGPAIGGSPHILIETVGGNTQDVLVDLDAGNVEPVPTEAAADSTPTTPRPRPTVDPLRDAQAPSATVTPLPPVSEATFTVAWSGRDDSGIDRYLIWVRVDGGTWLPWLETDATSAEYNGTSGSSYEFAAWAVDLAGNWSPGTDIVAQTSTRVE
jgi:hypothetical protein